MIHVGVETPLTVPAAARPVGWSRGRIGRLLLLLAIGLVAPALLNIYSMRFATLVFMYIALAQAWNIVGGYAGYISLAHPAFFGLGAFMTGGLMLVAKWPLPAALLVASCATGAFAALVGYPILRLKGHYFVVGSFLVAEATRELVVNFNAFGIDGSLGVYLGTVGPKLPGAQYNLFFYALMLVMAMACTVIVAALDVSRWGYGLRALRANEVAAELMGVNTTAHKVVAFVVSAVLTAVTGGIWGLWVTNVGAPDAFNVMITIQIVIMVLLGGTGTVWGPPLGVLALLAIAEVIGVQFSELNLIAFGAIVVVILLVMPEGALIFFGRGRALLSRSTYLANIRRYRV